MRCHWSDLTRLRHVELRIPASMHSCSHPPSASPPQHPPEHLSQHPPEHLPKHLLVRCARQCMHLQLMPFLCREIQLL